MALYVDSLMQNGWKLNGKLVANCHLFCDGDLEELHRFAQRIGMKYSWFQGDASTPHYDLTQHRRALAVACGAKQVERTEAVRLWKLQRATLEELLA